MVAKEKAKRENVTLGQRFTVSRLSFRVACQPARRRSELSEKSVIFKTASSQLCHPIFVKRVYRLPLIRYAILSHWISSRPFANGETFRQILLY